MDSYINYPKLINTFRSYDKICSGTLTFDQYQKLGKDMIDDAEEYINISFAALCDRSIHRISFDMVKLAYEAIFLHRAAKSENSSLLLLLILFKGVKSDDNGLINKGQFAKVAHSINNRFSNNDIELLYEKCHPNGNGQVSYKNVAYELFMIKLKQNTLPKLESLYKKTPFSQECLLV